MYDTLVVGGGPAGSYVAGILASQGHSVLVLEQHQTVGKTTCCTGIVGRECMDAFPVGRPAILREARCAKFFTPSGACIRLDRETVQAYILDRKVLDAELARSARGQGAEYRLGCKVDDISIGTEAVRAQVNISGQTKNLEAKTVVIASGFGSKLPQRLGLGKNGDFVMGAQAEVEAEGTDEVEVYLGNHLAPGFFAWLVPTSEGKALAGLLCRRHTGRYLRRFLDDMKEKGRISSSDVRISYGGIPLRPLPKTSMQRVIVVGDAAGHVKPTTGGGIYYGLLCAQAAADTLHQALGDNDFSAKSLARYDAKWRRVLSRELRTGRWARHLFEKLDDSQIERLVGRVQSKRIPESLLNSDDFSFDWHRKLLLRGARRIGLRGAMSLLWPMLRRR